MAKRSLVKRLSRDSRYSVGSAILDADTNNLGNEQTHWWKNLENNTIARLSIGSNTLYRTSLHLNSNSVIETDDAEEEWWKVLDTTAIDPRTVGTNQINQDRTKNAASTSESEEEPRITKKKLPLRLGAKKGQANVFQNILNHSPITAASKSAQRHKTKGSSSRSESGDTTDTDSKQFQGNSRNLKADDILKLKPTVFKKNQHKNIFDDVSKESESDILSRRKSTREITHGHLQRLLEEDVAGAAASSIIRSGTPPQYMSFEHEGDSSNPSLPVAHSTFLLQSTTSDISDIEVIQKPKPKLLKQQNKNAIRNVFEGILEEDEIRNEREGNKSVNKHTASNTDVSEKSLLPPNELIKTSQSTSNRYKTKGSNAKAIKNKLIEHSDASSDTSASTYDLLKPKTKLLKKFRRSPKKNIFEDVLMDDDDIESVKKSESKSTSGHAKSLAEQKRKDSTSEELALHLSDSSRNDAAVAQTVSDSKRTENSAKESIPHQEDEPDVLKEDNTASEHAKGIESTNASRLRKQSMHSVVEDSKQKDSSKVVHKESGKASVFSETEEAEVEKNVSTSRRHSRYSAQSQKQDSFMRTGVEPNISENATARQSKSLRTSRRRLISSDTSKSEAEEDRNTSRTRDRVSEKSQTQISSVMNAVDPGEIDNDAKTGGNLSKLHKRSTSGVMDELEAVKSLNVKRQSRISRNSERFVSPTKNAVVELVKIDNEVKRLSGNSSKSQNRSTSGVMDELEAVKSPNVKRQSRISRNSERFVSPTKNAVVELVKIDNEVKRLSGNSSKSQNRSTSGVAGELEAAETPTVVSRQSRILRNSKRSVSPMKNAVVELVKIDNEAKRLSGNLSKSQNRSISGVADKSEAVEAENTVERQSGISRKSEKQVFPATSRIEHKGTLQKRSALTDGNESQAEEDQNTSKRRSKVLEKSQEKESEARSESAQSQNSVRKQSERRDSSSKGIKRSSLTVGESDVESNEIKSSTRRRSSNLSASQNKVPSQIASKLDMDLTASTEKPVRRSSRLKRQFDLNSVNESKKEDRSTLKRQSITSRRSEKVSPMSAEAKSKTGSEEVERSGQTILFHEIEPEGEDDQRVEMGDAIKERSQDSSKSQKRSIVGVTEEPAQVENSSKRRSRTSSKSLKQISSATDGIKSESEKPANRRSRNSSTSRNQVPSNIAGELEMENESTPKSQGRRSSRLVRQFALSSVNESKEKENQITMKTQSGALSSGTLTEKQVSSTIDKAKSNRILTPTEKQSNTLRSRKSTLPDISESESDLSLIARRQTKGPNKEKDQSDIGNQPEAKGDQNTLKKQSMSEKQSSPTADKLKVNEVGDTTKGQSRNLNISQPWLQFHAVSSDEENWSTSRTKAIRVPLKRSLNMSRRSVSLPKALSERSFSIASGKVPDSVHDSERQSERTSVSHRSILDYLIESESEEELILGKGAKISSKSKDRSGVRDRSKTRGDETLKNKSMPEKQTSVVANEVEAAEPGTANRSASRDTNKLQKQSMVRTDKEIESDDAQHSPKQSRVSELGESSVNVSKKLARQQRKISAFRRRSSRKLESATSSELESNDQHSPKQSTVSRLGESAANERKKSARKQRKVSASRKRSSRKLESIDAQQSRKESITPRLGGPVANETEDLTGQQGEPASEKQSSRKLAAATNEFDSNAAQHSGKESTISRLGEPVANETKELTGKQKRASAFEKQSTMRIAELLNGDRFEVNAITGSCILGSRSENELSGSEAPKRFTFTPNVTDREDEVSSSGSNDEAEDAAVPRSKELGDEPNEAGGSTEKSRMSVKYRIKAHKGQRNIMEFLSKGKFGSTSQDFSKKKMEEMKQKLEKIKEAEMDALKASEEKTKSQLPSRGTKGKELKRKTRSSAQRPSKPVNKAFMINGEVYKARIPRAKPWVTNRLYKHLCRCMESRYKIDNKVVCEKFVQQLCAVTSYIEHEKQYLKYKGILHALMKEMARLGIIHSRLDFYHFCQEFFPYELRSKLVPMWLPGNKRTIPFDPGTLNEPLLDAEEYASGEGFERGEDRAWYDKTGPAEVINRGARRSGAVFGRVTPFRAHRSEFCSSFGRCWGTALRVYLENQSRPACESPLPGEQEKARARLDTVTGSPYRYAEEIAEQVRTQTPQGHQEAVDEESQGEKVAKLDLLALGHTRPRDDLSVLVYAVSGHEKHRHVHDVRGRELGGLRLDVLLLRRVRGEPEERKHRERNDNLTLTDASSPWTIVAAHDAAAFLRDRGRMKGTRAAVSHGYKIRRESRERGSQIRHRGDFEGEVWKSE